MKLRGFLGEKLNMTQVADRHGRVTAATQIKVGPNTVVKLLEKKALVAYGEKKSVKSSLKGILKGLKNLTPRVLNELELGNDEVKKGEEVKVSEVFRKGDLVDVTGTSKGKGFAGGMKRHGFHGGPKTHGQSDRHRAPGSIGSGTTPGRVIKGLKMAGHMGVDQVTIQGLEILDIDEENSLVTIKGAVPGTKNTVLVLKKSIKKKKAYHEPEIPALPALPKEEKEQAPEEGSVEQAMEGSTSAEPATEPASSETPSGEETND